MIEPQELEGQNSNGYTQTDNASSNLEKDEKCRDAILWIGQSYPKILCDETPPEDPQYSPYHEYCYLSPKKKKRRCFVHEAELRGCCRKVSRILKWMTPGKTRVFLVHRDVYKKDKRRNRKGDSARGSFFGYYILERIEIITDPRAYESITAGELPWVADMCQDIVDAARKSIKGLNLGVVKGSHRKILKNEVRKAFEKKGVENFFKEVGKGKKVTPRPRATKPWPDDEEEIEDSLFSLLEYLLEDLIEESIKIFLNPGERRGNVFLSQETSGSETDRYCSKRHINGAIYLVDALTAAITDEFMKAFEEGKLSVAEGKLSVAEGKLSVADGEKLFKEIVNKIKKDYERSESMKIPPCLEGRVEIRGELVLFKKVNEEYPVFEKKPRASFRGPLRVNGDELIEEICTWYKEKGKYIPKIPYCGKKSRWTISGFASKYGLSKEFARRVLRNYKETLKGFEKENALGDALVFSDVGEFTMTNKGIQFISYENRQGPRNM